MQIWLFNKSFDWIIESTFLKFLFLQRIRKNIEGQKTFLQNFFLHWFSCWGTYCCICKMNLMNITNQHNTRYPYQIPYNRTENSFQIIVFDEVREDNRVSELLPDKDFITILLFPQKSHSHPCTLLLFCLPFRSVVVDWRNEKSSLIFIDFSLLSICTS